ncbi:hypothetical protein MFLAVUS_011229 [Mucor flavus]|uniref:Resolvase HTH domain-containing protein n=1 Tax=Mucor flavus TaxID=439312 RepID=A0ABP9ZEY5_9FUNG
MKQLSKNKKDSVISLLEKGSSLRQIEKELKVGKSTVSRIRKEAGLNNSLANGGRPNILSRTDRHYCWKSNLSRCNLNKTEENSAILNNGSFYTS